MLPRNIILATFVLACLTPKVTTAQAPAPPDYHIETMATKQVQATLTDDWQTPNMAPKQWAAFIVKPPDVPSQKVISANLSLPGYPYESGNGLELSALHRPILWVRVDVDPSRAPRRLTVAATYKAVLFSRRMLPGKPTSPVAALSPTEFHLNTLANQTEDFTAPLFQQWLNEFSLQRKADESAIDYAHRVYEVIRNNYSYQYSTVPSKKASHTCWVDKTDCAGFSYLFVAAMRANNIPAHALVGRLAKSALTPQDNGQTHVRADFFVDGVGWVPVDMAYGVDTKGKVGEQYFGYDPGDLIVMHTDTDVVLHPMHLGQDKEGIQGISPWVTGTGKLDANVETINWAVTSVPVVNQ